MTTERQLVRRPTLEVMQQHIQQLCVRYEIACYFDQKHPQASWSWESDEIHIAPIRSAFSYATALHEIGHCRGRHQLSRRVMVRESWAWKWARANALFWTPAMERLAASALDWIRPRAIEMDRDWRPPGEELSTPDRLLDP
jgi:hypothetical protein